MGDDFLDAGSGGYNSLSGQNGNDTLQGGTGYDNISGGDGNDLISADAGNDDIYSGSGNDSISAGTGNDTINGENNDDTIDGGDGDDTISDGSGNDSISGGLGNDIIWIGSGNDTVNGGDGDDIFNVNSSTDTGNTSIDGGTGNDKFTVSIYNGSTRSVKGGAGQDTYKFSIPNTYSGASYVVLDFAAGVGGDYLDITEFLGAYGSGNYYKGGNPFSSSNEFLKLTQSGSDTLLQYDFDGSAGTLYTWKPAITLKNVLVSAITSANILDGTDPTSQTPPTGSVIISGTARQNQTLIATNTIADVNGLGTISYQWLRAGAVISGATQTSYILSQVDVGKSISVIASYTDGQGKLESVSSLASVSVSNVNDLPTGSLTISGTATQGQLLTASNTLADLDGLGTINYQWLSNGSAISGATSSTYTLTQAEVGKTISVKASYTDLLGTAESVTSSSTASVANVNDRPTGTVLISGTIAQGQVLTATNTLADLDGMGSIKYQWLSNGSAISGATGSLYTLTQADLGIGISVRVSYVDLTGIAESKLSPVYGGGGNDQIYGSLEADTLIGGLGDDLYFVDNAAETITEYANEGTDTVQSSASFTLPINVENLTLTGISALTGTGNSDNNYLIGNSENNILTGNGDEDTLDGGLGVDTLIGGLGNDTYVVDITTDTLTENVNEGLDTVQSSASFTLPINVENLTLTGTSALTCTGNSDNNYLIGNSGDNILTGLDGDDTLEGGLGVDTLIGGLGNDSYVVDSTTDTITENMSEGLDTVKSSASFTLSANVENLTLTGISALTGTGNTDNNYLIGNSGDNTLTGLDGNDTLEGGLGVDILIGGLGNDIYVVDSTTPS